MTPEFGHLTVRKRQVQRSDWWEGNDYLDFSSAELEMFARNSAEDAWGTKAVGFPISSAKLWLLLKAAVKSAHWYFSCRNGVKLTTFPL